MDARRVIIATMRVSKHSPFVGPRPLRNIEEYLTLAPYTEA